MRPIDPGLLACIVAIAEEGGVQRAAVRLGLTQSAVSQRLGSLEAQLGTVLVVRARPARLTPAGEALLRHAHQVRLLDAQFLLELRDLASQASARRQTLSIAVGPDHDAAWAWPAFDHLAADGIDLRIVPACGDTALDLLSRGEVQGYLGCLPTAPRNCVSTRLGTLDFIAVAEPAHVQQLHASATPLRAARLLVAAKDELSAPDLIALLPGLDTAPARCCVLPAADFRRKALLAGWGVAIVPAVAVDHHLAAGELVNAYPAFLLRRSVYWHRWNIESDLLGALDAQLARAFQALGARRLVDALEDALALEAQP